MSSRRRPATHGAVDPLAQRLEAEAVRLRDRDAADAEARRAHAGDLAWVTRDRDALLAAVGIIAEQFAEATTADPAERAQNAARLRRQILDAGADAARKAGGDHG